MLPADPVDPDVAVAHVLPADPVDPDVAVAHVLPADPADLDVAVAHVLPAVDTQVPFTQPPPSIDPLVDAIPADPNTDTHVPFTQLEPTIGPLLYPEETAPLDATTQLPVPNADAGSLPAFPPEPGSVYVANAELCAPDPT